MPVILEHPKTIWWFKWFIWYHMHLIMNCLILNRNHSAHRDTTLSMNNFFFIKHFKMLFFQSTNKTIKNESQWTVYWENNKFRLIRVSTARGARGTLRTDSKSAFDLRKFSHVGIYEVSQNTRFFQSRDYPELS